MTQPGIEPQSSGPLTNTLLIRPMAGFFIFIKKNQKSQAMPDSSASVQIHTWNIYSIVDVMWHSLHSFIFNPFTAVIDYNWHSWCCAQCKYILPCFLFADPSFSPAFLTRIITVMAIVKLPSFLGSGAGECSTESCWKLENVVTKRLILHC